MSNGIIRNIKIQVAIIVIIKKSALSAQSSIMNAIFLSLLKKYRNTISAMGRGILPEEKLREGRDELGRIGTALNRLIQGLKNVTTFSEEMGKGNFKSDFKPLSDGDTLGNSLIQLRENLKTSAIEEEKRKREDERRNWSNQGIAGSVKSCASIPGSWINWATG